MYLASVLPLVFALLPSCSAAEAKASPKPCTIHSPSTGSYYDLRPLDLFLQRNPKSKDPRTESWYAKGHDYPANFSLNICGPVIEPLKDINGVPESRWKNVSAFYKSGEKGIYSIGQSNSQLVFRGRKLVLNYTGGSPCPGMDNDGNLMSENLRPRRNVSGDDDDKPSIAWKQSSGRRKSTLLSLHCDRDPSVSTYPSVSFLGTPDHCVYVFEAHSRYFCGGATSSPEPGSLGPGGVFGIIILVALLTYLVGGCAYQRIVMRKRGWRQCPTYDIWMAMWDFVKDASIILVSSLTRRAPSSSNTTGFSNNNNNNNNENSNSHSRSRSGIYLRPGQDHNDSGNDNLYHEDTGNNRNVSAGVRNGSGIQGGRSGRQTKRDKAPSSPSWPGPRPRDPDEENRLIDQLDEAWE